MRKGKQLVTAWRPPSHLCPSPPTALPRWGEGAAVFVEFQFFAFWKGGVLDNLSLEDSSLALTTSWQGVAQR